MEKHNKAEDRFNAYLDEIYNELDDPFHKRIISAYKTNNPLKEMEEELGKILMEVIENEN